MTHSISMRVSPHLLTVRLRVLGLTCSCSALKRKHERRSYGLGIDYFSQTTPGDLQITEKPACIIDTICQEVASRLHFVFGAALHRILMSYSD